MEAAYLVGAAGKGADGQRFDVNQNNKRRLYSANPLQSPVAADVSRRNHSPNTTAPTLRAPVPWPRAAHRLVLPWIGSARTHVRGYGALGCLPNSYQAAARSSTGRFKA